jgi:hypothetical protein
MSTGISKEHVTIFMVKVYGKLLTSMKQLASLLPANRDEILHRNVGGSTYYTELHPREENYFFYDVSIVLVVWNT